jgi:hypothetical protein
MLSMLMLSAAVACGGNWRLAPPPDTGLPSTRERRPPADDRSARGHRHVHLPGEVRGQRLYPVFARAVTLTVYRDGVWLVDSVHQDAMIERLAALQPTLVSALFAFAPDERPTVRHRDLFVRVREAVRARVPEARFDLALDAMAYSSGPQVVDHMRELTDAFEPDLWFFERWDEADRENYAVVVSAIGQAHANGQAIGGATASGEIASDSDYGVVRSDGDARALLRQLRILTSIHPLPYLVRLPGEPPMGLPPLPPAVRAFVLTRITP